MKYVEEEVSFANGTIRLAGTLTLPDSPSECPAVVLLQGSGPLDRNEEVFGFRPFAVIADYFSRNGIAVLRYDSRGVGGSTGVPLQYTLSDIADDSLAAVRYLKSRCDLNLVSIGLCGHSQGGIVAPICAAQSRDVAFIICISGVGVTGATNHLAQTKLIAECDGATGDEVEHVLQSMNHVIDLVHNGASRTELEPEIARMVQKQTSQHSESTDDAISSEIDCHLTMFASPWFKSYVDHDARPVLESVECPVLLIFGGLDRQVPPEMNREAMVGALKRGGNSDYSVRMFTTANHIFQNAKTGSPSEYGSLEKKFVPGFLKLLSAWILETTLKS
ncbi:MAG: alpha/beta fold hydrolase [Gammaproteobacteria bacterium]|nr:alpha/beta fold hydrolase [Gammaproteobacteria bacterium]